MEVEMKEIKIVTNEQATDEQVNEAIEIIDCLVSKTISDYFIKKKKNETIRIEDNVDEMTIKQVKTVRIVLGGELFPIREKIIKLVSNKLQEIDYC